MCYYGIMKDVFYISNRRTVSLEMMAYRCETYDDFEKLVSDELLEEGCPIGIYLQELLWKYDKAAASVSLEAGLARSYVGNIINGKKNNPGRDALISICLAIGTDLNEVQYLLRYGGHAPLYVRRRRDVVIWFGFRKKRTLMQVDEDLYNHGFRTLMKQ